MLHDDRPDSAADFHILTVFSRTPPELLEILHRSHWNIHEVREVRDVAEFFSSRRAEVILCHSSCGDGSWKDILDYVSKLPSPPRLIVTSETADEFLWAEVLNLGGYDVIAQPFLESEVARTLSLALPQAQGARA